MSAELDQIHYVVIGAGINVNQETLAPEIQETATSICIERGQQTNRAELTARVLYYFEKIMPYLKRAGIFRTGGEIQSVLVNRDRQVRVLDPKGAYDGIARGINEKGNCLSSGSVTARSCRFMRARCPCAASMGMYD